MTPTLRQSILERDRHRCRHCGGTATEVDHRWPRALGGSDHPYNLDACCRRCNRAKGATPLPGLLPLFVDSRGDGAPRLRGSIHPSIHGRISRDRPDQRNASSPDERAAVALLRAQLDARQATEHEHGLLAIADWNRAASGGWSR